MAVFTIQNWKQGLDTRRSELTSQVGTLETAQNVHINQGAEIEKRKAFVDYGVFSADVFGLETGTSLFAFGSDSVGMVLPNGVTYIQCAHPTDSTKSMSSLICSCDFGGVPFCVAQFNNNTETYWFLDGQPIPGSVAGQVLTIGGVGQTVTQIAAQMYNILSGTDFTDAGVFVENLSGGSFTIYTAYGVTWSPVVQITSASGGQITTSLLSTETTPVTGISGQVQMTLYAGNSGSLLTLNDIAGSTTYPLISASVPWATNVSTTIANISTNINAQTASGLTALKSSTALNTISIGTSSSLPANYLKYQVSGNLCFENMALEFSNVANGTSIKNIYTSNGSNIGATWKYGLSGHIYLNISGVFAGDQAYALPYGTYLWIPGANDTSMGISGTQYTKTLYPNGNVFTYTSATAPGYVVLTGKAGAAFSGQMVLLTDILNSAGINYTGGASLAMIATAITANSSTTGFVASNATQTAAQDTLMYISRKSLAVNASAYNNIYFYTSIPGIAPAGFTSATPSSVYGFGSATPSVAGQGTTYLVTFSGPWTPGDQYVFDIVTPAVTYTAGVGNITQVIPSACLTLANRVHVVAQNFWYGCDNGDATQWEQQAPGAFAIDVSQNFQQASTLISLAAYQGRIALFANYVTMIWVIDANPLNIAMAQVLANIGTFCPLGPQSLGDLDVVFPSVTGFRSLRVRDLTLNAYVNDLGSPVDQLVQADIVTVGFGNLTATCGIMEPSANRYWLFLNGKIYVLSYFPSAKIMAAWSTYFPTYFVGGNSTTFVPLKMVVFQNQVYMLANVGGVNHLIVFGGLNNNVYDATTAVAATSWLDLENPGFRKSVRGLDFAMTSSWQLALSMNYIGVTSEGGQLKNVTSAPVNTSSYQLGSYPISDEGFHVKLQATCSAPNYSVLSSLNVHYKKLEENV